VETWLKTVGTIRAGVDLSGLSREDVSMDTDSNGNRHITIRLPDPRITHKSLHDEDWDHANNPWVWAPDRIALELREEIRAEVYTELDEMAFETGIFEEAMARIANSISPVIELTCPKSTGQVIFENGTSIEIGIQPVTEIIYEEVQDE